MQYPVADPKAWQTVGRLSPRERLSLGARECRYRLRLLRRAVPELIPVRRVEAPLGADAMILVSVLKNAARYLPSFLAHYRRLGVERFVFVDDRSDDGTRDILLEAPDVDLFASNMDYREASGGLAWRDLLVQVHGRGRWYVSLDCDEYLVFPGSETRSLRDFVSDLRRAGRKRALAVMLDIYPETPLAQAPEHRPAEAPPETICPLFDGTGYTMRNEAICMAVRGGPRQRLFGTDMRMTKFPVLLVDGATRFNGVSDHAPLPVSRNFAPVNAVLLHYKFSNDTVAEFRRMYEYGTHFDGGRFYRQMIEHEAFGEGMDLRYEGSLRYAGSEDLVRRGYMQDLRGNV